MVYSQHTTVITPWLSLTQETIFVCNVFNLNTKNVNALIARTIGIYLHLFINDELEIFNTTLCSFVRY